MGNSNKRADIPGLTFVKDIHSQAFHYRIYEAYGSKIRVAIDPDTEQPICIDVDSGIDSPFEITCGPYGMSTEGKCILTYNKFSPPVVKEKIPNMITCLQNSYEIMKIIENHYKEL